MRFFKFTLTLLATLILPLQLQAQITMGMVGDSLTDDYLGGPKPVNNDLAALSWGQILSTTRGSDFNFGGYRPVGDASGTWDSIRYYGSEYNYATSGAGASNNTVQRLNIGVDFQLDGVSGSSYLSSQTAGLATHVSSNAVDTAFVGIGSNDFFYRTNTFDFFGNATLDDPITLDQSDVDDIAGSILAGVDELIAAGNNSGDGVDVLLALLPEGTAGGTTPEITAAIQAVNAQLTQGAAERGVATVDLWGWTLDDGRTNPDGSVNIGDLVIEQGTAASDADISPTGPGPCDTTGCALESHANYYAAEDGLHPNTIIQGLIANQIIGALNDAYGHNILKLSDTEILSVAGVSVSPVPVPAAAWFFGSALVTLAGFKRKKKTLI